MDANFASAEVLTFDTNTSGISHIEVDGLLPQVQYECQVKALLKNEGFGHSSNFIYLWTKPHCKYLPQVTAN